MDIVLVTTNTPFISTTYVGEQVTACLQDQGHTVTHCYVHGIAGKKNDLKALHQKPVICLVEHVVPEILDGIRYIRPQSLLSVWTGNWDAYDKRFQAAYLMAFSTPKFGGMPIKHISHSHYTDRAMTETALKWFNSPTIRGIRSNTEVRLYGIEETFRPSEEPPNPYHMIVPYNRLAQTQKNVKAHHHISATFLVMREPEEWTLDFYYAPGFGPEGKELPFDTSLYNFIKQPETREEFRKNARKYGMFLCTSQFESFGLYYLELLASGVVGVFLDKPWIRLLLPNYPYIVSPSDAVGCMTWVAGNYEEAREKILTDVAKDIWDHYSIPKFTKSLVDETARLLTI